MKTFYCLFAFALLSCRLNSQTTGWIVIDSMENANSVISRYHNQITYDPYSKVVAIVHPMSKAFGTTSDNIGYMYSTNNGSIWQRRVGPFPTGLSGALDERYPSITLSNATRTANKDSVLVEMAFSINRPNETNAFAYGVDPGVGAASLITSVDTGKNAWGSHFAIWSSENTSDVWLAGFAPGTKAISLLHSSDGVTYSKTSPKQFADSIFRELDGIVRGTYRNVTCSIAIRGKFVGASDTSVMTLGVSSSTDKGATWSNLDICNYHTIAGLSSLTMLPSNDFAVDIDGTFHWLTVLIDTTIVPNKWQLTDIYKQIGGTWSKVKIRDLPTHENWRYGSLNESYVENELSVSKNPRTVVAKWLEDSRGVAYKDSLPIAQIKISYYYHPLNSWSLPFSISPNNAEDMQLTHIAPLSGDDQTIYLTRAMQSGKKSAPAETAPTLLYFQRATYYIPDGGRFDILSPKGGEAWEVASHQSLSWDSFGAIPTAIDLSTDNGMTWQLVSALNGVGSSFLWTVPDNPAEQCKIRISGSAAFGNIASISNVFTIKKKPVGVDGGSEGVPYQFFLSQNHPNPFNPSTIITYTIPSEAFVTLDVFDMLGRKVESLVDEKQNAGAHSVSFYGGSLSSGIYTCTLQAGGRFAVRRLVLLK